MGGGGLKSFCNMALRAARVLRQSNRLLLSMGSPDESIYLKKAIDSVTVPGTEGTMTLTNNHSLIVSQLRAGVITVRDGSEDKNYFISDGYVFYNQPTDGSGCCTAEISVVEVVPTSSLDKDRATQVLAELMAAPKDTEWDKTKATLGSAMIAQIIKAAE